MSAPQLALLRLIHEGQVAYSAYQQFDWDYGHNRQNPDAPIAVDFRRTDRRSRTCVTARIWALIDKGLVEDPHAAHDETGLAHLTDAGRALAAPYPQLSTCRWCTRPIRREEPGGPWTSPRRAGFAPDPQCPSAPNPEDRPMPRHEPGTADLTPPETASRRPDSPPPPAPRIPRIPWSGTTTHQATEEPERHS